MDNISKNKSVSNNGSLLNKFIELNIILGLGFVYLNISLAKFIYKSVCKISASKSKKSDDIKLGIATILSITNTREYEPAQFFGNVQGTNWSVTLQIFPDRIERILKTPCERSFWMRSKVAFKRSNLDTFTPALAAANKLSFDVDGASIFTKNELAGIKVKPVRFYEDLVDRQQIDTSKANSDKSDSTGVYSNDNRFNKACQAIGVVTHAGLVEVQVEGRKPYKIFSITVKENDQAHEFRGKELAEKFNQDFSVGDVIKIVSSKVKFSVQGKDRMKNIFAIDKIKSA